MGRQPARGSYCTSWSNAEGGAQTRPPHRGGPAQGGPAHCALGAPVGEHGGRPKQLKKNVHTSHARTHARTHTHAFCCVHITPSPLHLCAPHTNPLQNIYFAPLTKTKKLRRLRVPSRPVQRRTFLSGTSTMATPAPGDAAAAAPRSFARRDRLRAFELSAQAAWAENHTFEAAAAPGKPKYFVTFPFPYMNGLMHLGHAFTVTKADFAAGYQRLKVGFGGRDADSSARRVCVRALCAAPPSPIPHLPAGQKRPLPVRLPLHRHADPSRRQQTEAGAGDGCAV